MTRPRGEAPLYGRITPQGVLSPPPGVLGEWTIPATYSVRCRVCFGQWGKQVPVQMWRTGIIEAINHLENSHPDHPRSSGVLTRMRVTYHR